MNKTLIISNVTIFCCPRIIAGEPSLASDLRVQRCELFTRNTGRLSALSHEGGRAEKGLELLPGVNLRGRRNRSIIPEEIILHLRKDDLRRRVAGDE